MAPAAAAPHAIRRGGQQADRPGDGAGQIERQGDRDAQRDGEGLEDGQAHLEQALGDLVARGGDLHGGQDPLVALHRNRGRQQQVAILGLAQHPVGFADQGTHHFGEIIGARALDLPVQRQILAAQPGRQQKVVDATEQDGRPGQIERRQLLHLHRRVGRQQQAGIGDLVAHHVEQAGAHAGRRRQAADHLARRLRRKVG